MFARGRQLSEGVRRQDDPEDEEPYQVTGAGGKTWWYATLESGQLIG
jgi:hypothetical protein